MAALDTVANYLSAARTLLQDTVDAPYRYSDTDLVAALNNAISEIPRIRPDLYFTYLRDSTVPTSYSSGTTSASVNVDLRYRMAVLYYIVGYVQLRDDENTQDARAGSLLTQFIAKLTGSQA